jgi:hypothetical protein
MIKTKHISIVAFVVALAIPLSFIASSARADKPIVHSTIGSTPAVAPIVLVPDKPAKLLAQNTKPVVKKTVAKKKVVKKKAKKKERLILNPAIITPATAPHTPR